jgi:hypothetical protein
MKLFTRNETLIVSGIFTFTFLVTLYNLNISLRRSRDAQRRSDISALTMALKEYYDDFGFYPPSKDGKIVACKGENFIEGWEDLKDDEEFDRDKFFSILTICEWGEDSLRDVTDDEYEPYMQTIPQDPKTDEGMRYIYLSNSKRFQLYSYMEGAKEEIGYDEKIVARNLECGSGYICCFGKSYSVPVDRSIEDYEKELLENVKVSTTK